MKILIVSQHFYPETFSINDLAFELQKRGHKVSVVAGLPNYGYKEIPKEYKKIKYEVINDVEVFRIKHFSRKESRISIILNYLSFWRNSKRFLSRFKDDYDVVFSFCMSPIIASSGAIIYRNKKKIPHLHYVMDLWPDSVVATNVFKEKSIFYKLLYKWSKHIYDNCDSFVVSSPSFKEYLESVIKIKNPESVTYIPQISILPQIDNFEIDEFKKHKFNIVYCGNIGKLQLIDLYIKAIKELDSDIDVSLTIIGMGSESKNIVDLIKENNLENKVYFLGPRKANIALNYYKNCSCLIAGLKEGGYVGKTIPNKINQYMYFGKPIIGVFKGDARNILEQSQGSLLADETVESIKNAIIQMYNLNEDERNKLGANNLKFFEENLSTKRIVDDIEIKLNSLINR